MTFGTTKGILLLSPANIDKIVSNRITLGQYMEAGGIAVIGETIPLYLPMEPFINRWLTASQPDRSLFCLLPCRCCLFGLRLRVRST